MINQPLWTALVTPFNQNSEKIDLASLKRLLEMQSTAKNGAILFGSTGESLSLSEREKREALEYAISLKLDLEIMVGVPSANHHQALEWMEYCKDLPIAGFLMTTPIYTKPGELGQTKWFESLLNRANKPAMLYNVPGRSAIKLNTTAVANLKDHSMFVAIKDASGSVESMVEYQQAAPNIAIYCGDDDMMPSFAAEGAAGLISVASNAWPLATRRYVELSLARKDIASKAWWQASKALFSQSNPIPIKALLKELGLIECDCLRLPLDRSDLKSTAELLAADKAISQWFKANS